MAQSNTKLVSAALAWIASAGIAAACASSDEAEIFPVDPGVDAGGGTGGTSGAGVGGAGGSTGGSGGSFGGTGGAATGGTGGVGVGGSSGTGGAGVGGGTGTCNPSFCPSSFGTACCITPNGPCGVDMGMGCMPSSGGG